MTRKIYFFLFFLCCFFINSCGENQQNSNITLPIFDLECSSAQATDCDITGVNKTLRIGLAIGKEANCSDLITAVGSSFFSAFEASGSTTSTFDGFKIEGAVTSWVDRQGVSTDELPLGDYTACAYLDQNSNGLLDLNEAIAKQNIELSLLTQLIDIWENL